MISGYVLFFGEYFKVHFNKKKICGQVPIPFNLHLQTILIFAFAGSAIGVFLMAKKPADGRWVEVGRESPFHFFG